MSGASGVPSKLSSKWARGLFHALDVTFGNKGYKNETTYITMSLDAQAVMGDRARADSIIKLRYTDTTGCIQVAYAGDSNLKSIFKNILTELVQ